MAVWLSICARKAVFVICYFETKKIQIENKLTYIKVSGLSTDGINNDDSIRKRFDFYLKMLTNF